MANRSFRPLLFIFSILFSFSVFSQENSYQQKQYNATRLNGVVPQIDGFLEDEAWNHGSWDDGFTQREPYDGKAASQRTAFKILYNDNAIYVAIRAYDSVPEKIEKRLSRRDDFDGDWVGIAFDSYNDKLTAFSFAVSAAGVKNDLMVSNEENMDDTWDPVWFVKTSAGPDGWIAEMKIPLTQIRFANKENHEWGLQVMRWIFRNEEFITWQHIPQESSRWVSRFGMLQGITGIKPKKEVEIIPYVMGKTERYQKEEGNPYADGSDFNYTAGIDGKVAVTNDLTLNFTVNPDFGQVEADPSEVNLTAFETFFQEKRPFFVEGNNIFQYRLTGGDGNLSADNLFYSRRIGRQPNYEPDLEDNQYARSPEFTRILGAFKLSGKTRNGWSVGIMESMTKKEVAKIDTEGVESEETVEPFTNFFNTRLQKDFNKGKTIVGGMVTATNRNINDPSTDFLPKAAYTGGLDFQNFWKDKTYYFGVKSIFSRIEGNSDAIIEQQESSRRYFQRPDATHLSLDTTLTSLSGFGGAIEGGKIGTGHWRYLGWVTWRSPGLELNDQGYLREADIVQQVFWVQYRIWEPFGIFRSLRLNFNQWTAHDFAGKNLNLGGNINFNGQFKNYWSAGFGVNRDQHNINRSELRGGPALHYPGDWNNWLFISSDERKKVSAEVFMFNNWGDLKNSRFFDVGLEVSYRPTNSLSVSVEPGYMKGRRELQYFDTFELVDEDRYVIATLSSEMLSADVRINFNLSPDFSFQFWGQPFIFSGDYSRFKAITDPDADEYENRFHEYSSNQIFYDGKSDTYRVDENMDGLDEFDFERPDFNFFEFRSNLVARWEYVPGSTLYVVWSQGRTGDNEIGQFNFRKDLNNLYNIVPHNIFLVKLSYRLSM